MLLLVDEEETGSSLGTLPLPDGGSVFHEEVCDLLGKVEVSVIPGSIELLVHGEDLVAIEVDLVDVLLDKV